MPLTDSDRELIVKSLAIPSGYATIRLRIDLQPTHKQVLDTLFAKDKSKVVFRAGNGTGKTSTVISSAVLYAIEVKNAMVVSTAGTYRQVVCQLVPNLKSYSHLFPKWTFNESSIVVDGIQRYVGFSTSDQGMFQGWHAKDGRPLLMIVDEAAAVDDEIFKAIDRCQPSWLLVAGSPLDPQGVFYEIETNENMSKFFQHFKLTQFDCPWIKKEDIEMLEAKWGKGHPLVLSSVYADFASESENSIISFRAVENCIKNPPTVDEHEDFYNCRNVFIDVAAGSDQNVIALFHKGRVSIVKKWRNKDTMSAAGEILVELQRLKGSIGLTDTDVSIDADGLGIGIANRLQELGWKNINLFHGNSPPKSEDYLNCIAEVWIQGCKKIEDCKVIIPNDPDLKGQLIARQMKRHSNGKLKLESKEDMRDRGVPSPDVADAVLGSMYEISKGIVTFAKAARGNRQSGLFAYT